jgi:gentisate 1,2-dioxygenase
MREFEAVREREPDPEAASYEWRYGTRAKERVIHETGVVVVHDRDRPWEISPQSRGKYLLWARPPMVPGQTDAGPAWPADWWKTCVSNWSLFLHNMHTTLDGVTTSGQHRHQGGLGLFIVEGEGWSVVNNVKYPWKAGDLQLLPIIPGGCVHQHFATPGTSATWLALSWNPYGEITGGWVEQIKVGTLVSKPPQWTQLVSGLETGEEALKRLENVQDQRATEEEYNEGLYGQLLRMRDAERDRLKKVTMVVDGEKAPTETNPMGIIHWYLHPSLDEPALKTMLMWVHEIPPHSRSGRMRHQGGRVHYVWQGRGHTVVDGATYEWEKGAVIGLPIKAFGIEYQHFNDSDETVKLLTVELNMIGSMGVDLGTPFDVIEPAPEYRRNR